MKSIGEKRKKFFIEIRKRKKLEFFKESRRKMIQKKIGQSTNNQILNSLSSDKKNQLLEKCSECKSNLELIISSVETNHYKTNRAIVHGYLREIKEVISEHSEELEHILVSLFYNNFFERLLDCFYKSSNYIYSKLVYSMEFLINFSAEFPDQSKFPCRMLIRYCRQ